MLRGGLQVVTQRNANCKPNSPRALWSSQLFRAFVLICASLSLFYVSLALITVKGLRVATVFISNQWLSRTRPYRPPHLHSIEWRWPPGQLALGLRVVWIEIFHPNMYALCASSKLSVFSIHIFSQIKHLDRNDRFSSTPLYNGSETQACVCVMILQSCATLAVAALRRRAVCPHASS